MDQLHITIKNLQVVKLQMVKSCRTCPAGVRKPAADQEAFASKTFDKSQISVYFKHVKGKCALYTNEPLYYDHLPNIL